MIKKSILTGSFFSLIGVSINGQVNNKPNIIIFQVDDLGYNDVACFGSRYYDTPNIDKLAANGMKFVNAYSPAAVSSPSRAAILTGRHPARIGITDWIRANFQIDGSVDKSKLPRYETVPGKPLSTPLNPFGLKNSEITIAEMLKPLGYVTCHLGKWHLGDKGEYPENQGFDINIGGCDLGEPPSYFDPYIRQGKTKTESIEIFNLKSKKAGDYLTDREAEEAENFIRNYRKKPFFLYYNPYAVHTPLQAKEALVEKYRQKHPSLQKNPVYAAMIHSVDEALGRVLRILDNYGLTDNTIIVFTSDNGGLHGVTDNSPLRSGKGFPYEGGIKVPFIVQWKSAVKPGTICETPIQNTDLFPTILQVVGGNLPDVTIDGKSILPLLKQVNGFQERSLFWHFPHYRNNEVEPYSIVRRGDFKLIRFYEQKKDVLYNLKTDISEINDLSSEQSHILKLMREELNSFVQNTGALIPKPLEDKMEE